MNAVDLIPGARRERQRQRRRVRGWVGAGCAYAAMLGGTLAAAAAAWPRDQEGPATTLAAITAENEQHRERHKQLAAEILEKQKELAANRAVGNQPDWSVLLALLSATLGPDAALRQVVLTMDLEPPAPAPTAAEAKARAKGEPAPEAEAPARPRTFSLHLGGVARSQLAVAGVVKRLEETGLFDWIELVATRREGPDAAGLTAFSLRCRLGGRSAGS